MIDLDRIFKPRSVAFVGATEAKVKWGFIVLNNLVSGGYEGTIYPVNPRLESVMGFDCYRSVRDIPGEVDLAIFTVPAAAVVDSMRDCAEKGVRSALVISAGFSEMGERGAALQDELVRIAKGAGMPLVGPNGQGVCCPKSRLFPWMPLFYPPDGRVSFVCQSGNILNMLIGHVLDSGYGVAKGVSSGNEAVLRKEDYFEYFASDPDTDVIVAYMEGVDDGRRFIEKTAAASRSKPVVLLKGGRSRSGMLAARSHTGAMAVEERVFEGACARAGVVLADTIRDAGITASAFLGRPLPAGRRVGIVTGGGGLGVIAADACVERGLEVPALSEKTLERIRSLLPEYFVPGNPVDLVAGLDLSVLKPIIESVMTSGDVDSVLFIFIESRRSKGVATREHGGAGYDISGLWDLMTGQIHGYLDDLYDLVHETGVPLYVASNFGSATGSEAQPPERRHRVMMFDDVESACSAISAMAGYGEHLKRSGA